MDNVKTDVENDKKLEFPTALLTGCGCAILLWVLLLLTGIATGVLVLTIKALYS